MSTVPHVNSQPFSLAPPRILVSDQKSHVLTLMFLRSRLTYSATPQLTLTGEPARTAVSREMQWVSALVGVSDNYSLRHGLRYFSPGISGLLNLDLYAYPFRSYTSVFVSLFVGVDRVAEVVVCVWHGYLRSGTGRCDVRVGYLRK